MTDEKLLHKAGRGDEAAFLALYERHRGTVYSSPESSGGYFTRVDMEDFQPADEVKIRIVKRGSDDEK